MEPASPSADASGRGPKSALRRFGPLAVLVAVAVGGAALLLVSDPEPDEKAGDPSATTAPADAGAGSGRAPDPGTGAISFSRARADGLDVEFAASCDHDTGRVAIPFTYAGECYASVEPDPSYEAPRGVTDDTIRVGVYVFADNDPLVTFGLRAVVGEDTPEQVRATFQGFTDVFNATYQTYGRQVELVFIDASGFSNDEIAARSDAVRAALEADVFAVWGNPLLLARPWAEEIQAQGIVCLCGGLDRPGEAAPQTFAPTASTDQTRAHLVEYISKKLAGKPAAYAGDPTLQGRARVFGRLHVRGDHDESDRHAEAMAEALAAEGVELVEDVGYQLDVARLQEQASTAIARLQAAGVTTVILSTDPLAPISFTGVATEQGYFPEWLLGGNPLIDTTAFARTYDQTQWASAFGISSLPARVAPELDDPHVLYEWFLGEAPPARATTMLIYPNPALFFLGLQAAGPNLTTDTFGQGLFSLRVPEQQSVVTPLITYGDQGIWDDVSTVPEVDRRADHFGIDDFTELWWDPAEAGLDELGQDGIGMYRMSDGGRRYLPGAWTSELRVFDPEGSIAIFEERPPGDELPSYPPPR